MRGELFGGKGPKALAWHPLPYMEEYLEELEVNEKTSYAASAYVGLAHFGIFALGQGIMHPEEIERAHLLRFQAYVNTLKKGNGQPLSESYRQQLMKYVRTWCRWMEKVGHISANPFRNIKINQVRKKPKPLDDEEIQQLFATHNAQAFSGMPPFMFHRRETVLVLLYGWGLRIHELAALTCTGMDMRLDFVVVKNKRSTSGINEKVLPYGDEMKAVVNRWLNQRATRAKQAEGNDSLLIEMSGAPLSLDMIYKIVTDLGKRAGVEINPHRLRDSFGTKMLENDVAVERIMKMMGHTQRKQTLAYARVQDHTLKSSHDAVMGPILKQLTTRQPEAT